MKLMTITRESFQPGMLGAGMPGPRHSIIIAGESHLQDQEYMGNGSILSISLDMIDGAGMSK